MHSREGREMKKKPDVPGLKRSSRGPRHLVRAILSRDPICARNDRVDAGTNGDAAHCGIKRNKKEKKRKKSASARDGESVFSGRSLEETPNRSAPRRQSRPCSFHESASTRDERGNKRGDNETHRPIQVSKYRHIDISRYRFARLIFEINQWIKKTRGDASDTDLHTCESGNRRAFDNPRKRERKREKRRLREIQDREEELVKERGWEVRRIGNERRTSATALPGFIGHSRRESVILWTQMRRCLRTEHLSRVSRERKGTGRPAGRSDPLYACR